MPRFFWQRQHDDTPDPRALDTALDQFLSTETWDATRAQLEAQPSLLLSDAAIATLQRRIATRQTQPDAPGPSVELLARHLHLLEAARTQGIPAAWDTFQAGLRQEREDEIAALAQLLEHDPAAAAYLMGMSTDAPQFQALLAQLHQVPSADQPLQAAQGAPLTIPPSLRSLINEITALEKPHEMPSKIALLQQAIQRIDAGEGDRLLWAAVQNNLAIALWQNPLGDRAKSLEQAIAAYQAALQVRTRDDFPIDWARTKHNLGVAWRERIVGDKTQNLGLAIAAHQDALQVFTLDAFPVDWAKTLIVLGNVWSEHILENSAQNREHAILAYQGTLQVFTCDAFPVEWAMTQMNLGTAWSERILGDTAQNKEHAILAYQAVLQVYTRDAFPFEWAAAQHNLGNAWSGRIVGDKAQNLEQGIAAYHAALQVLTRDTFPMEYRNTQDNLARAYEARDDWQQAHLAYLTIRNVQRDLVALATSEETRTATIAAGAEHNYYLRDVCVLARQDPPDLAAMAEALEEGRAQSMRAALDLDAIDLQQIVDPEAHARAKIFIAARNAWRAAQQSLMLPSPNALSPREASVLTAQRRDAVQSAHHAFELARDTIRQHDNPDFLSPMSDLEDIAQAVTLPSNGLNEAIVYLAAGPEVGLALIVLRDGRGIPQVRYVPLPRFTYENTFRLIQSEASHRDQAIVCGGLGQAQMDWAYSNLQKWGVSPCEALTSLPPNSGFAVALLRLQAAWRDAPKLLMLLEIPFEKLAQDKQAEATLVGAFTDMLLHVELDRSLTALGELGLTDLAHELAALGIQRVALVPYGRLAPFPLPAVLVSHEGHMKRLGDCFEVTIAPSARTLTVAKARAAEADRQRQLHAPEWQRRAILAAGNPRPLAWKGGNLPYAETEADTIRKIAKGLGTPEGDVLKYTLEQATRKHVLAGLGRSWYAHLAMHGQYHQEEPRQSRIFLAGDQKDPTERTITLAECLEGKVDLVGLRLLVLSACETSIINVQRAADEVVGMASAFLQAGAAGVIASLWPVSDQATYLLMARFTNLYLDPRRNWTPARCLAEAQRWLREETTNRLLQDLSFNPAAPIPLADEPPMPNATLPTLPRASKTEQPDEEALLAGVRKRSLRYTQSGALAQIHAEAARRDPDALPYADPSYWAAFTVTGC